MRLSRIALPILLTLSIPACAANAGAAAGTEARVGGGVVLQNRAEALRLMDRDYPLLLRDARVTGEVFVQVTLDAGGRVTASTVTRSTLSRFNDAAQGVAGQLRFSAPAAAGQRVQVRMLFALDNSADISIAP